jgi:DNA-binding NarL/FixJ family response regulator
MKKVKVLFVDDHKMINNAIASMLEDDPRFIVVGESANMKEAVGLASLYSPDIILAEINRITDNGVEITRSFLALSPGSKIVALSVHALPSCVNRLMEAGASGYITKTSSSKELTEAILEIYSGKRYICREIRDFVSKKYPEKTNQTPGLDRLTVTELTIISYIKEGLSFKEMSIKAGISKKTIDAHRYNILKKLNLKNTAALVNFVDSQGF